MILLAPPVAVRVEGDGAMRFVADGRITLARSAKLQIRNGVIVGEAGVLAPRILAPATLEGPLTVGLDGTIRIGSRAVGRIVLAIGATLTNPGEGLAGVIRASGVVAATPAPVAKNSKVVVTVRARSSVSGDRILLGDVAEILAAPALLTKLKAMDLGRTPIYGATRGISAGYVRALLRGIGITPAELELTVPEGAVAERDGMVIEAQSILDTLTDLPEAQGFIPARPPIPLTVPTGELALTAEPVQIGPSGRSVTVLASVNGKPAGRRTIPLLPDPSAPAIKAGEAVRLRLVTGSASVEVAAKVKTGGRVGSSVTVIAATGSTHTGTLVSPNLVEVKL